MADQVEITNVGGDGVASEATLASLVAAIEKMARATGKDPKSEGAKVQKLHNEAVKSGITVSTKNTDALKKGTDATKKATDATKKLASAMQGAALGAIGAIIGGITGMAKQLVSGTEDLTGFAEQVPLIGGMLGILTGIIDENLSSFRELSKVGATFGEGLNGLRHTAASAGLPLGEFTELVTKNAGTMRMFGGDVAAGAVRFAQMSKELRNGPGKAFINLGYTSQELNESLIEYAEFSATQITQDRRNNKLSAQSAASYLKTIDELAAVTGKRRDQIREEMNAAMADQRSRLAMASMSEKEQQKFSANLAAAPASLQEALKDAADGVMNNPLAQGMSVASETFRKNAANIKNMSALEFNNFMAQVGKELDASGKQLGKGAQAVMASGTGYGQALAAAAELRDKQFMTEKDQQKLNEKRLKEAQKDEGIKNFADTIRDVRSSLMEVLTTGGANSPLSIIQGAISDVGKTLNEFVKSDEFKQGIKDLSSAISGFIKDIKEFGFAGAIEKLFGDSGPFAGALDGLGDVIGKAFTSAITNPYVIGAIAAIFLGPTVLSAAASAVSGLFSGLLGGGKGGGLLGSGGGGGGGGKASPGAGLAKGGSNAGKGLGSFLGQTAGGAMKGAATGLAAFANPAVIAGAAALGAAIALIGAGIAGATWLLGKSLPTLQEGLKSFEDLDGAKLEQAGSGMVSLAAGLAAFGAGSVVGGMGNLVGNISEGIGKLFGGDDPIAKLERFSNANIDAAKVEANANAMVAFSKAMGAAAGGQALGGLGAAVAGIGEGISGLFGGEDIFEKLVRFSNYTVDAAKVETNAKALIAFNNAMSSIKAGGSIGDSVKGVIDSISSWFSSGTEIPYDEIKKFGEAKINAEGVKNAASGIVAYSEAMSKLSAGATASGDINLNGFNKASFAAEKILAEDIPGLLQAYLEGMNSANGMTGENAIKIIDNVVIPFLGALGRISTASTAISGGGSGNTGGAAGLLKGLSELDSDRLMATASGMQAITDSNFGATIQTLQSSLDAAPIRDYTIAIEGLIKALDNLNKELAESNNSFFGSDKASAGELLKGISVSSAGTGEGMNQLNSLMAQMVTILNQMKTDSTKIERNTRSGSNIASGTVSQ